MKTAIRNSLRLTTILGGAAFATLGFVTPVSAQSEPEPEVETARNSNVIIVTATRREESLQDVPVAVTAISGDTLANSGVGSIETLESVTPSLTFTQSTSDQNNSVSIRGVGTSVFSVGVEPAVSIVVDDVVMARQGQAFQDLVDVDRVEVLRGPQSTLFGKNASAGVISVTTSAPTPELSGRLSATIAEGNEFGLGASLSGPLAETVSGRLTGFYKKRDGHIDNVADDRSFNGYENWGLRGKLLFEASPNLDITLSADYRESRQDCCVYVRASTQRFAGGEALEGLLDPINVNPENTEVAINADVFNDSEQYGGSVKVEYEFDSGLALTAITAARGWDFRNNLDVDGLALETPVLASGGLTFDLNSGTTEVRQYSQEIRLASPQGDTFDFVVGAFGYILDIDRTFARRITALVPFGPGGSLIPLPLSGQFESTVGNTNLALFGSGNFHASDQLTIFGGVRFIYEELDYTVDRDPTNVLGPGEFPLPGVFGTAVNVDNKTDDSAITGEIGLRYALTDDVQAYARYARGYKGQAIDASFGAPSGVEPVAPEISDAFELGLKSVFADGDLIVNIAAFHTDFDDFQQQAIVALGEGDLITSEARLTNVGTVRTRGVEIDILATPGNYTTIQGGIAYTDASITSFPNAGCYFEQTVAEGCVPVTLDDGGTPGDTSDDLIQNLQDLAGTDLPNSPTWRLTGSIRQEIPLSSAPFNGFFQVSGRYQSDVNFSLIGDPLSDQQSYAIVNLSAGLIDKDGAYSLTIFVNNVFDKFYTTNRFNDFLYSGVIDQYVPRDFERYFGARLSLDF